ncbi:hypothetical protein ES702_02469 [subsurface metagenome]
MMGSDTKHHPPAITKPFILNTANILAQILASQSEFEHSPDLPVTNNTIANATSNLPLSPSFNATKEPLLSETARTQLQPPQPVPTAHPEDNITTAAAIPTPNNEDIKCQTCHRTMNKHEFTVEEREKNPDSVSCSPPNIPCSHIHLPKYLHCSSAILLLYFLYLPSSPSTPNDPANHHHFSELPDMHRPIRSVSRLSQSKTRTARLTNPRISSRLLPWSTEPRSRILHEEEEGVAG